MSSGLFNSQVAPVVLRVRLESRCSGNVWEFRRIRYITGATWLLNKPDSYS